MENFINNINSYYDYKNFDENNIEILAKEIRRFLIENVSKTGGHLASNLGIVELTLATHKVFDFDNDKIIYDVGHQSYVHKILTGRAKNFKKLRQFEGMSGFPDSDESKYDHFNTGHSSTSISAAIGMAIERDIKGDTNDIIAVIGDASLGGGLALEGLNYLANSPHNLIIILNDNEMSIDENVGAISRILSDVRLTKSYRKFSKDIKTTLSSIPYVGKDVTRIVKNIKDGVKNLVVPGELFAELGINYFGPVDGHNYWNLKNALETIKQLNGPKILHLKTKKGMGYKPAMEKPHKYHGVGKFDPSKPIEKSGKTFSDVASITIEKVLSEDKESILVCPAMLGGTGMKGLIEKFPNRIIDVGIEEQNAVTIASGYSKNGKRSYVATYSTFFQRAYDQILHDVCLQNLPVTLLIDRGGIVGEDGKTHNGIFDLSYLSHMPNITIFAPADTKELEEIILKSHYFYGPVAIRYPKGKEFILNESDNKIFDINKWETYGKNSESVLVATGRMVKTALFVKEELKTAGIDIDLINARKIKPINQEDLDNLLQYKTIFTLEDNVVIGGFSSYLQNKLLNMNFNGKIYTFGFEDGVIEHGSIQNIFEKYNLDVNGVSKRIKKIIEGSKNEN